MSEHKTFCRCFGSNCSTDNCPTQVGCLSSIINRFVNDVTRLNLNQTVLCLDFLRTGGSGSCLKQLY